MIHYIIKVTTIMERKDKSTWEMVSYYQNKSSYPIPLIHLVGEREKDKAHKFDCKSEAARFIKKTWGNRKGYTVEKVITD